MRDFLSVFTDSATEFTKVRSLVTTSLLVAVSMVIEMFSIDIGFAKLNFAFLAIAIIGMLFGPCMGMMAGFACDIVGYLAHPSGGFLPAYVLVGGLQGLFYGLFLYQKWSGHSIQFVSNKTGKTTDITLYLRAIVARLADVVIINLLIQKYFPRVLPYLADVLSPMQAHCEDIKRRIPNAKTVFIGPCVAKKDEAEYYEGIVDAVLTYEELTNWLKKEGIEIKREQQPDEHSRARFFPTTGGILKTMAMDAPNFSYLALDGVENCIAALKEIDQGKIHHCFIEMSACVGSCAGGPVMEKYGHSPLKDYLAVAQYAGDKDFEIEQPEIRQLRKRFEPIDQRAMMPSETEIRDILREMGKFKPSQELNCGSCGYDTCREKAIAIYQGKAEISMCLPYLMEKAENVNDTIARNSPNGIIMLNDQLEVQQINPAALKILNLRSENAVLGDQVVRILDPTPFLKVKTTGRGIFHQRSYLAEYGCTIQQTIVPAEDGRMLLCIMRDVSDEEEARRQREEISRQTVEVADKVVDKQMRIVQEIASLLGETAAETKIALTKLKESITNE